jgi:hypothetical protein
VYPAGVRSQVVNSLEHLPRHVIRNAGTSTAARLGDEIERVMTGDLV